MPTGCPCASGFYENNVRVCLKCHFSCLECKGSLDSDCISCLPVVTSFRDDLSSSSGGS